MEFELDSLQKNLQQSISSFPDFKDMHLDMEQALKNYIRKPLPIRQQKSLALFTWREQHTFPGGSAASNFNTDQIVPLLALVSARKDCANAYWAIFISRGANVKHSNTTLLICKASKKDECKKKIAKHSIGLKVEEYYGPTRSSLEESLHLQDIVITS